MKFFLIIFLVIIACQSCQYEPTGSNFVDVDNKLDTVKISISIQSIEDTIWIEDVESIHINFDIDGSIDKMVGVHVFYDSLTNIFNTRASGGSFPLPKVKTDSIEYHTLDIIATTRSGSGSLADFAGAEGLIYHNHYVLVYFQKRVIKNDSLKFEEFEGKLKINWDRYISNDFSRYVIQKKIIGSYKVRTIGYIYTMGATSFIDESYIGEPAEFIVKVQTKYNTEINHSTGNKESEFPKINIKHINSIETEISWTKAKYWGSFQKYHLWFDEEYTPIVIDNINVLSYIRETSFGNPINFIFRISNQYDGIGFEYLFSEEFTIVRGDSSFKYNEIETGNDNFIYFNYSKNSLDHTIYQYDIYKNQIINSIKSDKSYPKMVAVSPNGNYILYLKNDYMIFSTPSKFPEGKIVNKNIFSKETQSSLFISFAVSDNGIAVASSNSYYTYLFDIINDKIIYTFEGAVKVLISKDGKYLFTTNLEYNNKLSNLYLIEEKKLTILKSDFKVDFAQFSTQKNEILFYSDIVNKELIFFDCSNSQKIKSFQFNESKVISYDFNTGYLLANSNQDIKIILDYNKSFSEVNNFTINTSGKLFIKNKTCYFSGGTKWDFTN